MEKLRNGYLRFRHKQFPEMAGWFRSLGSGQQPHTLFVTCCDSRVVPSLITGTGPGELFIVRNIANIVPPWEEGEEHSASASAIEYAVVVLEVPNIVVCGHSNCGGCQALFLDEETLAANPLTRRWLELIRPLRDEAIGLHPEVRAKTVEQSNVLIQLDHLMGYPYVRERVQQGMLHIAGWYYDIEQGTVQQWRESSGRFEELEDDGPPT